MKYLPLIIAVLLIIGCGGGGGGGGSTGGGNKVTLSGRVIWIETGAGPNPAATVKSGSVTQKTDLLDGFFEFETEANVTSATVTFVPTGASPVVRTFTFPPANGTVDLGDLYIGPQVVTLKGKVEDVSTSLPVAGAKVSIAGRTALSSSDGSFSVTGVAYSTANPAVFLGLEGVVTAPTFFARQFSPSSLATGGVVQVGLISLTPLGSGDPPPPPYDVQGSVTPIDKGANAVVTAEVGSAVLRRVQADSSGRFTLWLPVGTYVIKATKGSSTGQTTITVTSTNVIKSVNVSL